MARLTLVQSPKANSNVALHRASASEGEAARKLLEAQGFTVKGPRNKQYTALCPFHEGPGAISHGKSANFYLHAESSKYYCQSASCGEKGNLRTLEVFFGIDSDDDDFISAYRDRDIRLKEFEANLVPPLRQPFYDHGLTDQTIERFRLGYEPEHVNQLTGQIIPARYVIPYLQGRRPKFFRYYSPDGDPKWKYTWEPDSEATLFNPSDAMGDPTNGVVIICEGEQKAMMLVQMGYAAVGLPGATTWKDEWTAQVVHARRILVCFDTDNPAHHVYDKPEKEQYCSKCRNMSLPACIGHNPGQEAALKLVQRLGWRAKNVVLPLPDDPEVRKTDINDYFMRDGFFPADFAELATGKRKTQYQVQTLGEITESPPEEAQFLVDQGIISVGGRLLVAGKPKVGKSLFVNQLCLSLASGMPFLKSGAFGGFKVDHASRVLLLDRELSKYSLFKRLNQMIEDKPALRAAHENLLIDHDHLIRLDQINAYDVLMGLVDHNGAEVCVLDTAYKFFGGDMESSASLMKAYAVLDKIIHETGCAFVLTHHLKKTQGGSSRQNTDIADPDNVAGSFLWTGWPNATILLNFLDRSVENPFNSVCTFTAFRDAPPPEPVALYRSRDTISYTAIERYSHAEHQPGGDPHFARPTVIKPTTELVANLLLECCPATEEDFLHMASGHFGVSIPTLKPYFIDVMSKGDFVRSTSKPPVLTFKHEVEPELTWEQEHALKEKKLKDAGMDSPLFTPEGVPQ